MAHPASASEWSKSSDFAAIFAVDVREHSLLLTGLVECRVYVRFVCIKTLTALLMATVAVGNKLLGTSAV